MVLEFKNFSKWKPLSDLENQDGIKNPGVYILRPI
jgi:hypothetical protein